MPSHSPTYDLINAIEQALENNQTAFSNLEHLSLAYRNKYTNDAYESKVIVALNMLKLNKRAATRRALVIAKKAYKFNFPMMPLDSDLNGLSQEVLATILLSFIRMKHILKEHNMPIEGLTSRPIPPTMVHEHIFCVSFLKGPRNWDRFMLNVNVRSLKKTRSMILSDTSIKISDPSSRVGCLMEAMIHEFGHMLSFTHQTKKPGEIYHELTYAPLGLRKKPVVPGSAYSQTNAREFVAEAYLYEAQVGSLEDLTENNRKVYQRYIPVRQNMDLIRRDLL